MINLEFFIFMTCFFGMIYFIIGIPFILEYIAAKTEYYKAKTKGLNTN